MFGIGTELKGAVETGNELEGMEDTIKEGNEEEIQLEIIESSKRLRISRAIWEAGLNFDEAVQRLKHQPQP